MSQESEYRVQHESAAQPGALAQGESQSAGSADAVLELARQLLEQGRSDDALAAIEQYAASTADRAAASEPQAVFDAGVSDQELEIAFEAAEPQRDQMVDADDIAERAIRLTEAVINDLEEIPSVDDEFVDSGSSYATQTVATLLERQGDGPTASKVRAIVDSSQSNWTTPPNSGQAISDSSTSDSSTSSTGQTSPRVRDRRTATIMELERWLVNLRGVAQ